MAVLIFGILSIVALMVVVMGTPFVHYLRRDRAWEKSQHTVQSWYSRV